MTSRSIIKILALAIFCGVLVSAAATAPALWWLSEADRAELIAQTAQTHGTDAAEFILAVTR